MNKLNLTIAVLLVSLKLGQVLTAPAGPNLESHQAQQEKPTPSLNKSDSATLQPVKLSHGPPSSDYMAKGFDLADHVVTDYEYERVLEKLRREALANELNRARDEQEQNEDKQELNFNKNVPSPFITGRISPAERTVAAEFSTADCPICLEPLEDNDRKAMQCGHVFHPKCISRWSDYVSCPKCETSTGGILDDKKQLVLDSTEID